MKEISSGPHFQGLVNEGNLTGIIRIQIPRGHGMA